MKPLQGTKASAYCQKVRTVLMTVHDDSRVPDSLDRSTNQALRKHASHPLRQIIKIQLNFVFASSGSVCLHCRLAIIANVRHFFFTFKSSHAGAI